MPDPSAPSMVDRLKAALPAPVKVALRPAVRAIAPGLTANGSVDGGTGAAVRAVDRFPFGHYLASEKLGVVLCAIPKCGCSTTKYWFARAIKGQEFTLPVGAIHYHCWRRYSLERKPPERAQYLLGKCVSFSIVRDPVERLASAYLNKFVPRAMNMASKPVIEAVHFGSHENIVHDSTRDIRRARKSRTVPISTQVNYRRGITFREFVEYVVRTPNEQLDPHWRPQVDFISAVKLDLIAPLERIGWAIAEVQRRAGMTGPTPETREPKTMKPSAVECLADVPAGQLRTLEPAPSGRSLYDDALRKLVQVRYERDAKLHRLAASQSR